MRSVDDEIVKIPSIEPEALSRLKRTSLIEGRKGDNCFNSETTLVFIKGLYHRVTAYGVSKQSDSFQIEPLKQE